MLTNQPNATDELLPRPRYTRTNGIFEVITETYGVPNLLVVKNIFGAWPSSARPQRTRDAKNVTAMPQLNAEVRNAALMTEGSAVMPAFSNAMTNGLC